MTNRAINRRSQPQVMKLSTTRLATDIFQFNTPARYVARAVVRPPQSNRSQRLHFQVADNSGD